MCSVMHMCSITEAPVVIITYWIYMEDNLCLTNSALANGIV